jgi:hypothetical protein
VVLALTPGLAADASNRQKVIVVPPGARLRFGDIECLARVTTYHYLTCLSFSGKYEVAVAKSSVVIVRARDGKIIYRTP